MDNESAAVRKDREKLSANEIFDILERGDLSEIEDLCDDETDTFVNNGEYYLSIH